MWLIVYCLAGLCFAIGISVGLLKPVCLDLVHFAVFFLLLVSHLIFSFGAPTIIPVYQKAAVVSKMSLGKVSNLPTEQFTPVADHPCFPSVLLLLRWPSACRPSDCLAIAPDVASRTASNTAVGAGTSVNSINIALCGWSTTPTDTR